MAEEVEVRTNMEAALLGDETIPFADPEQASRDIVARILEAADVESVFAQAGTTPARDILGRTFTLRGARWNRSTFDGDAPLYAILEASDPDTGDAFLVTCGSRNVMAQAWALQKIDQLPRLVAIEEAGKETAAGYRPMWLVDRTGEAA